MESRGEKNHDDWCRDVNELDRQPDILQRLQQMSDEDLPEEEFRWEVDLSVNSNESEV